MDEKSKNMAPTEMLIRYLANEASSSERLEVEKWRDLNEANKKEFNDFSMLWKLSGHGANKGNIDIEAEWKRMEKEINNDKGLVIPFKRFIQIAASIILVASLGLLLHTRFSTNIEKTGIAEIITTTLPDGSVISMNANSKISYKNGFGTDHREINLEGEAYFRVSKNKSLPFVITAKNTKIEVVGTEFNVNAKKEQVDVQVIVTEGKVKFYKIDEPGKEIMLIGGQSGSFKIESQQPIIEPEQNKNELAWVTREVDFRNTALTDVAKILKNTYHRDFDIDPAIRDCPITVKFKDLELLAVLEILASTLDLEISKKEDKIHITGKGC